MSNADTFKYRGPDKRAPFPFIRDAATAPGSGPYITLASLQEACDLWWRLEEVSFDVVGTCLGDTFSFTSTHQHVLTPVNRISSTARNAINGYGDVTDVTSGYVVEIAYLDLLIAYASGDWRLYYTFAYQLSRDGYSLFIGFDSSEDPFGYTDTGTFSMLGHTFTYYVNSTVPVTGHSITASSTSYTLV